MLAMQCLLNVNKFQGCVRPSVRSSIAACTRTFNVAAKAHLQTPCSASNDAEANSFWASPSEAQILQLLVNLPEGKVHDRWRLPSSPVPFMVYFVIIYSTSSFKTGQTVLNSGWFMKSRSLALEAPTIELRRLNPLLVLDADGSAIYLNLQIRLEKYNKL